MNDSTKETVALLQELIRNSCVNPPGNEMRNIKTIEKYLKYKGISCKIFESAENRGNLIARIKGTGEKPTIMFGPSHVDVVPVDNEEDWSAGPFSGEIKDGLVWGRGALDMLFLVASQVQAFSMLAREDFKPKGNIILCIVCDEEVGGMAGTEWMINNHPEEMKADYSLGEHGGLYASSNNIAIVSGEKGGAWLRLTFHGKPGHGAMPLGSDNAVVKAGEASVRLSKYKTPRSIKYLKNLVKVMGSGFFQRILITNKLFLPIILNNMVKSEPGIAKALDGLTRMTISPNRTSGGIKVNSIPSSATVDIDVRTLPGQDFDYITKHVKKALGKKLASEVKIDFLAKDEGNPSFGNSSDDNSELVKAMKVIYKRHDPECNVYSVLYPAITDLRFMRGIGANAYGYGLFNSEFSMTNILNRAHGTDEHIDIKSIELTTKVHYELAKEFLG